MCRCCWCIGGGCGVGVLVLMLVLMLVLVLMSCHGVGVVTAGVLCEHNLCLAAVVVT